MNLHTLLDNLEALVRSGGPQSRILSMLEEVRMRVLVLERLADSPLPLVPEEAVPDANVAPCAGWTAGPDSGPGGAETAPSPDDPAPNGPTAVES
jgi:hypothetical protein